MCRSPFDSVIRTAERRVFPWLPSSLQSAAFHDDGVGAQDGGLHRQQRDQVEQGPIAGQSRHRTVVVPHAQPISSSWYVRRAGRRFAG
ncbi:MAG: hypothetical protein O2782_12910 [bacterium]|nr:hypothetical protein [bacterium]